MALSNRPRGFIEQTPRGGPHFYGSYVGIVKKNTDAQRMGRLAVYIPEIGGANPEDPNSWITVSYASPFAGATDPTKITSGSDMASSQQSYGFWMIPPDLNNEILVTFAQGDLGRGFWFACVYQQNMDHMIPGIACNVPTDSSYTNDGWLPPVTEYNKSNVNNVDDPQRPVFKPLADGLKAQGLNKDGERGPSSTSARRESPSKVFGFLTPRGNTVHIDDNDANEFIRMRTRSGAQILIHETSGYVYINSKNGDAWVEISDSGVDIYSTNSVCVRAKASVQVRADKDIIFDAGSNIWMRAAGDITMQSGNNIGMASAAKLTISSGSDAYLTVTGDNKISVSGKMATQAGGDITSLSGGNWIRSASKIYDNSQQAPEVAASPPEVPQGKNQSDGNTNVQTIVECMPTHEPWGGHPNANIPKPIGEPNLAQQQTLSANGQGGPIGNNGVTAKKTVQSGTGAKTLLDNDGSPKCALGVGTLTASDNTFNAIQAGADASGQPFGRMMAFADVESNFQASVSNSHSNATGLYQFIPTTWSSMVAQYGGKYNISSNQITDPVANATMAGQYATNNANILQNSGISDPTTGQIYMAHLLGPGSTSQNNGAIGFINAYQTDPNTPLSSVLSAQVIAQNPRWFAGKTTVGQAYENIDQTMNAKDQAYSQQAGMAGPCSRDDSASTTPAADDAVDSLDGGGAVDDSPVDI